ncbi:MAG: apolipoprotein N-acyltransferase [Pseudomonadota bacterium]
MRATRFRCAALTGFFFGFGYFLTGLYWIAEAFLVDPWRHGWLIPFAMTALPAGLALFFAAGATIAMALWAKGPARVLALGLGFGLSEFARGHVLTGLPWNLIGYGLAANETLMQSASLFGVYALSVLAVILFTAPAAIWAGDGTRSKGALALSLGLIALLGASYLWGSARLDAAPDKPSGNRVRLVQANIDQADKWQPGNAIAIFDTYLEMTRRPGLEDVDIIVWPETALPFPVDTSPEALAEIGAILPKDATLFVGAVRWTERRDERGMLLGRNAFNSLLAIGSDGKLVATYDKIHLVPFGEFLPYQDFLESLGIMQLTGVRGGFSTGSGPRLMEIPGAPPTLPLICYEIIFPDEVRTSLADAAEKLKPGWILNVTNDAWFGSSAGPHQHFHQARVRAVELGLPLVRVANTGISAVVDSWGRVLAKIGIDTSNIADAELPQAQSYTVYALWGHLVYLIVLTITLFGWFICRASSKAASLQR